MQRKGWEEMAVVRDKARWRRREVLFTLLITALFLDYDQMNIILSLFLWKGKRLKKALLCPI